MFVKVRRSDILSRSMEADQPVVNLIKYLFHLFILFCSVHRRSY